MEGGFKGSHLGNLHSNCNMTQEGQGHPSRLVSAFRLASMVCDLCSNTVSMYMLPTPDLILCCHCLEILSSFEEGNLYFYSVLGPTNCVACLGRVICSRNGETHARLREADQFRMDPESPRPRRGASTAHLATFSGWLRTRYLRACNFLFCT